MEILFGGKKLKDGEWVYGLLMKDIKGHFRIQLSPDRFSVVVVPETICQYVGLPDKNGNNIFANNILSDGKNSFRVYSVPGGFAIKAPAWCEDKSDLKSTDELTLCPLADAQTRSYVMQSCEVIGNIYELKSKNNGTRTNK